MKKVVSILLALIMCGTFIVGASAICYNGEGDIEFETGLDLNMSTPEDTGNSYWYEWEIAEEEGVGFGEIEFTIYYGAFDWQGEQYCESPEDYPAMLEYLRWSYGEDYTVTDCYIDGYPAIVVEYYDSETSESSADVFICGGKYFYVVNLYIEDIMIYSDMLDNVKGMELNGETGEPLTYDTSADEEYDENADDEVYAESDNTSGSASMSPVVRNIIIIAVVAVVAIVCGTAVCVVVIVAVKGKKK